MLGAELKWKSAMKNLKKKYRKQDRAKKEQRTNYYFKRLNKVNAKVFG